MLDEGCLASEHISRKLVYKDVLINDVKIPMIMIYIHPYVFDGWGYSMSDEVEKCKLPDVI